MKQKIFALCDLEEGYAFRMAEYLVEKVPFPYLLHLFTKTEELEKFLERQEISVLLIGEGAMRKLTQKPEISNLFVLQETEEGTEKGAPDYTEENAVSDYPCISKFQSPEAIISQVLEQLSEQEGKDALCRKQHTDWKMIGMYSPVKRCLQTTFALTMGQLLAKRHSVLYLNFETYSGFGRLLQRGYPADMLDMVYYFRCAREKLSVRLPSIVQNINGLDFIPPGQTELDMQGISGENWLELLELLGTISSYEYLILDLTDGMNGLFELLLHCYKIYTITRDDGFAMAKIDQYEKILQRNDLQEIAEKTVKCRFPLFQKLPSEISLMTHGEFAGYVNAIIQEDLYDKEN